MQQKEREVQQREAGMHQKEAVVQQREAKALLDLAEAKIGQDMYGAAQVAISDCVQLIFVILTQYATAKMKMSRDNNSSNSSGSSSSTALVAVSGNSDMRALDSIYGNTDEHRLRENNADLERIFAQTKDPVIEHERQQSPTPSAFLQR